MLDTVQERNIMKGLRFLASKKDISVSEFVVKILVLHSHKPCIFTRYLLSSKPHKELQRNEMQVEMVFERIVVRCWGSKEISEWQGLALNIFGEELDPFVRNESL